MIAALTALALLSLAPGALAADGDLDPSFANAGVSEHDFGPGAGSEGITAVATSSDGHIVSGGIALGNGVGVIRHNPDGSLDPSLDGDGIAFLSPLGLPPAAFSAPEDIALFPDGRIAIAGFGDSGGPQDSFVSILTAAGQLDPSFGNDPPNPVADGVVRTNVGSNDLAMGVAVDDQGRVITAGRTGTNMAGGVNDLYVARYRSDGSLDPSFAGGIVTKSFGVDDRGFDVALQADGKIDVLATTDGQYEVVRLLTDGTPDPQFGGGDGVAPVPGLSSPDVELARLALAPDSTIVVVGSVGTYPDWALGLGRLLSDGSPDTAFSGDGSTVLSASATVLAGGVAVADDGRIVVAATAGASPDRGGVVLRLLPDGSADAGFGTGGTVSLAVRTEAYAVSVQPDRRILVGGDAITGSDSRFLLERLLGDTIAPDTAITKAPKKHLNAGSKARFAFAAVGDVNTSLECALKRPRHKHGHHAKPLTFSTCTSPLKYKHFKRVGKYRFLVRATDPAGNVDATPAKKKIVVR